MDLKKVRELMNKLNHGDSKHGVGKATSVKTWRTDLAETDDPDGNLLDARVGRVDEAEFPLGYVGPASPRDNDDAADD
ncbi:hypothetical protein [[Mycobacterium] nativiensis]|uniref:Uncharacterized protein n=1 Tax=[Mycobacterium] nativiensis TaxID=2855503 RepID=A0ABU5XWH8_9MYCO|nr:hypothetical protein [Mycolicibacter sp. MYC340]MEB3032290.1 hypothetical protein [Mycolicibacter sp. MYC340]